VVLGFICWNCPCWISGVSAGRLIGLQDLSQRLAGRGS